jgi:hypothetical protein
MPKMRPDFSMAMTEKEFSLSWSFSVSISVLCVFFHLSNIFFPKYGVKTKETP